jgi:hypothetical protein
MYDLAHSGDELGSDIFQESNGGQYTCNTDFRPKEVQEEGPGISRSDKCSRRGCH